MTHQEAVDSFATERYLLDEMSDVDRDAFEEHYFSCETCAQDVRTAAAMTQAARGVFATDAAPGSNTATVRGRLLQPKKPAWYRSTALPWAVAASLAALATYQAVQPGADVGNQTSPRALHPVTLRPDSRGQEAVVRSASPSDGITLAVEINGAREGAELGFEITNPAGRAVTTGRAEAPSAGAPLLLWVPASVLSEPARYAMSVTDRATGQPLGTYRFVLSR